MQYSFLRCHLLAWIGGIVFAYIGGGLLTAIPPKLLWNHPFIGPMFPVFAAVTLLEILLAWRVAVLLGAYDLMLMLAFALTLALGFGFSYSMDVHSFLPDDGHTMFDILTWGARPFDFWGQIEIFSFIFAWALLALSGGVFLKRIRQVNPDIATAPSGEMIMYRWLGFDLCLILCVTVVVLRIEVVNRIAEGKPENMSHAAELVP